MIYESITMPLLVRNKYEKLDIVLRITEMLSALYCVANDHQLANNDTLYSSPSIDRMFTSYICVNITDVYILHLNRC